MARKITVALEDDLDGGPADETVRRVESVLGCVFPLGAGRELKIILGGSSGGRMEPARAGLRWRPLA